MTGIATPVHAGVAAMLLCTAAWASPFAYITNQGSHDVSVIDLASQQVVADRKSVV